MTIRAPLSPTQSAWFAMGRVLVLFSVWDAQTQAPLDIDRAMLIDFASQHPRALSKLVPDLPRVLRAHRLNEGDLSDLFAERQFDVLRERFSAVLVDLIARDLLMETNGSMSTAAAFTITARGREKASEFASALSLSFRAVYEVFCDAWRVKNVAELLKTIRRALPNEARQIADLAVPLPSWLVED